jgi:RHS repeat-associated protein
VAQIWPLNNDRVLTAATPGGSNPTEYQGKYGCWSYNRDPLRQVFVAGVEDSFGNRTLEAFSSVACTGTNPTPQIKAVYNSANNQIQSVSGTTSATFIYDASGNTLYDGNNYYWYDAEGQLCAEQRAIGGTITQYVYDAEGARIAKGTLSAAPGSYTATCAPPFGSGFTLTARYLVDQGGDQVTELAVSGPPSAYVQAWAHSNVWAGGKLVATYDLKGIHYELSDPLGTKRVQANALGQVDETCTSLPFGNDLGNPIAANCTVVANSLSTGDDATEHHFTQKERDTESGNDYFFARYYSSALGRFTTPDWSTKDDPVPYAQMDDPQSLNLYAYVRNNPVIHVDLDGHDFITQANQQWIIDHQISNPDAGLMAAAGVYQLPAQPQQPAAQQSGQQQTTQQAANGQLDKNKLIKYMDDTGGKNKKSSHQCAKYCSNGLDAAGATGKTHTDYARKMGAILLGLGFVPITAERYYTPKQGDFVVFDGNFTHPIGHVAVFDGKYWVSDFKQRNMSPYRDDVPTHTIYRYPDK